MAVFPARGLQDFDLPALVTCNSGHVRNRYTFMCLVSLFWVFFATSCSGNVSAGISRKALAGLQGGGVDRQRRVEMSCFVCVWSDRIGGSGDFFEYGWTVGAAVDATPLRSCQ